jgi:hypothetical protein
MTSSDRHSDTAAPESRASGKWAVAESLTGPNHWLVLETACADAYFADQPRPPAQYSDDDYRLQPVSKVKLKRVAGWGLFTVPGACSAAGASSHARYSEHE